MVELSPGLVFRAARALRELAHRLDGLADPYRETELADQLVAAVGVIGDQITRISSKLRDLEWEDYVARGRELARSRKVGSSPWESVGGRDAAHR